MGLKSDCGGGQRGVAVPQVLEQSRASQGHWGAVLAEVCRGHHDDDDYDDDDYDDDDYDDDYDDDKPAGVTQNRWKELSWLNLNDEISSPQTKSDHTYKGNLVSFFLFWVGCVWPKWYICNSHYFLAPLLGFEGQV